MTTASEVPVAPSNGTTPPWHPELPEGEMVALAGRGEAFVRVRRGEPGAPVFVLLHGLTDTADLNWFTAWDELSGCTVVALDQRGHGDGIPDRHILLQTCADDVAALLRALDIERGIVVGFSLGGAVAQLVWRRHRSKVAGLVLVATAARFPRPRAQRLLWAGMAAAAPVLDRAQPALEALAVQRARRGAPPSDRQVWAQQQLRRNDPLALLSARRSLAAFSSVHWAGDIDVPVAFVATARDRVVPPAAQQELIGLLPDCTVETLDADHGVFVEDPELFAPALGRACRSVSERRRTP